MRGLNNKVIIVADVAVGYGDEMDYYPGDQARRWLRSRKAQR